MISGRIVTLADGSGEIEIEWMRSIHTLKRGCCTRQGEEQPGENDIALPVELSVNGRISKGLKVQLKRAYERKRNS